MKNTITISKKYIATVDTYDSNSHEVVDPKQSFQGANQMNKKKTKHSNNL